MPELPEVETVKESLKLRLSNKKIIRARVLWLSKFLQVFFVKFLKKLWFCLKF